MKEVIFSKYGIDIVKHEGKFYIKYDSGELASKERESEISSQEAEKAMRGAEEAYEVIIASQNRDSEYKPYIK